MSQQQLLEDVVKRLITQDSGELDPMRPASSLSSELLAILIMMHPMIYDATRY